MGSKPNDKRNFFHKRLIGAVTGFIGGGPGGAIGGFLGGGGRKFQPQIEPRPVFSREAQQAASRQCPKGDRGRKCRNEVRSRFQPNGSTELVVPDFVVSSPAQMSVAGGQPVMGRFGAALIPESETRLHRACLPGMVLGNDDLCYNRRDIKNSERKYPKGRAPLLTGGERNAITKAAAAARKITRTQKQLMKLGMLKAPTRRAAPKPRLALPPANGVRVVNVE